LLNCNLLLHMIVQSSGHVKDSCMPPDLLQQHGLRVLQALAAPVQQLLLSNPDDWLFRERLTGQGAVHIQLYSLRAAKAGMTFQDDNSTGEQLGCAI
jgi:hypothetical protein